MVFQIRKRRGVAKSQYDARSAILEFPDEIILAIVERAGVSEILRLRESGRLFAPACVSAMRTRLKTLYIHPARSSVERAQEICKSDLGSEIEEVCFVNKIHWTEMRARRQSGKDLVHTWPSYEQNEKKQTLNLDFLDHHSELLYALASLPKLRALLFKDKCDQPGFNMVSEQKIHDWALTAKDRTLSKEKRAEAKLYGPTTPSKTPTLAYNFADVDAITAALTRLKFSSLTLCDELPFADIKTAIPISTHLGNLTHVELHMHLGWQASDWQNFCHQILQHAAPNLQELKLTFRHNPAALRRKRPETSLDTVVAGLDFPVLKLLELRAVGLPDIVPCVAQIIDFEAFLSMHCGKLEILRVARIFPTMHHLPTLPGQDVMTDDLLFAFGREVHVLEEEDESIKAWRIGGPVLDK
jgi:hypothetical protein